MKIRIFALAKELGLDSKELIEYANAAGVEVKNSALASISPEEKKLVMAQIQAAQRGNTSTAVKEEAAPVRRDPYGDRGGKIRKLEPTTAPKRGAEEESDVYEEHPASAPQEAVAHAAQEPGDAEIAAPAAAPPGKEVQAGKETEAPSVSARESAPKAAESVTEKVAASGAAEAPGKATPPAPTSEKTQTTAAASSPAESETSRPSPAETPSSPAQGKRAEPAETKRDTTAEKRTVAPLQAVAEKPMTPVAEKRKTDDGSAPRGPAKGAKPEKGEKKDVTAPAGPAAGTGEATSRPERGRQQIHRMEKQPAAPQRQIEQARPATADEGQPVNPGPRRGSGGMREMRPVGTVQTNVQGTERKENEKERGEKERKRPQLARPLVAAPPKFTPARPKAEAPEGPAQKPDVLLTPGMMKDRTSPLSAHLASRGTEKKPGKGGRPGVGGRDVALDEKEQAEALKARRKSGGRGRRGGREEGDDEESRRRTLHRIRSRRGPVQYAASAKIDFPITVRSLSEAMGRPAKQLLGVLFKQGKMYSINDVVDEDLAQEIALELGVELDVKRERSLEESLEDLLAPESDESVLEVRPPVVTILGHVDHGKTTLVDKIRSANIAAGEAGGITQHIAAYQVDRNGQKITFVDTPGHAAFGEMRARGANVTDIVVLVVAADDGVMPQTEESISHAKAAGVPMIVALNKIDLPGIDENRALQSLAARDVLPAEWGGDVEVIRTSGLSGKGLDELLDTILISAELRELKANPDRPAVGVCLEAFRDEGRGPIAWIVVQNGTLRVGDVVLCGSAYGRVRAMYDDADREVQEAGPSMPVKIAGLDDVPESGARCFVVEDVEDARELATDRQRLGRAEFLASQVHRPQSLEEMLATAKDGEIRDLPLIIKADSPGSIEAIRHELAKLDHPEVRVRLIHTGVGGVNESDVSLASASGAVIVAFHVIAEDRAELLADREGVDIRRYNIIYEVADSIRSRLEGLLKPELREVPTGRAIVLQTFKISRTGMVAGCRVLSGTIERPNRMHLIRQQTLVNTFSIASLRREKDDVREVREGMECGIRLDNFNDLKEGDLLEAFRIEEVKRTFD